MLQNTSRLSFFSLFLLSSLVQAAPRPVTHVACVGDSITEGAGASGSAANYPSQLQQLMGNAVQVQNFGRSGATLLNNGDMPYTQQSQYTAATNFVENAGPDAVVSVIILLGANDSKPFNWDADGRPEQFHQDYLALVDHFLELGTKPTVYVAFPTATGNNPCCEIRGDVIHDAQVPLIQQIAEERHLPIIDLNTPTLEHPEYFGDGVHPNDGGYGVVAGLVKEGLEREPSVAIVMPEMNAMVPAGLVPIVVEIPNDTVAITSVDFFDGDELLGTETMPPFEFTWDAAPGVHELSVRIVDATLADATSESRTVTITEAEAGGAGGAGGVGGAGGGGAAGEQMQADAGAGGVTASGGLGGAGMVAGNDSGAAGMPSGPAAGAGAEPASSAGAGQSGAGAAGSDGTSSAGGAPFTPQASGGDDSSCSATPGWGGARTTAWMTLGLLFLALARRQRGVSVSTLR